MTHYTFQDSKHVPAKETISLGALDKETTISTTWVLNQTLEQPELDQLVIDITVFALKHGLSVTAETPYHLKVVGPASAFDSALNVSMTKFQSKAVTYHATESPIKILSEWGNKILDILGLDTKPIAYPHYQILQSGFAETKVPSTFYPTQLATLYNFPEGDGKGQTVGIIELGGGYNMSDLTTYFSTLSLNYTPNVVAVGVDGGSNNPGDTSGANYEVVLDIEVIAAIAPAAKINVYFAPNTGQGFYDAVNMAMNQGCGVISISWGSPESNWGASTMTTYNSLFQQASNKGVTILAAAGDNGSSDGGSGNNVDFPASSPYVLGCGGTHLVEANTTTISQETVWNNNPTSSATGGGISTMFAEPTYQSAVTYPLKGHRGVPDVSGDGDPNSGYNIYIAGKMSIIGGTSAVAPLWSGLLARVNQSLGKNVGFLHPIIYANPSCCRDITQGNNGSFSAGTGWDPCTGNGSPNGQALLSLLKKANSNQPVASFTANPILGNAPLTVTFTDTSTNTPTSWLWSFGDGSTSTVENPVHVYTTAGTFTVSLTATNAAGSDTASKTEYVSVTTPGKAPVADFRASATSGFSPMTDTFTDTSTNSPTSWLWNFGDGTTSTVENPTHVYIAPGTYTVSLTATNAFGSDTNTKTAYVTVTSQQGSAPIASFTSNVTSGPEPLTVVFTDTSTNTPTSWAWNFGDGNTSTAQNPTHVYTTVGSYTVTLLVSNSFGSNTVTRNGYITVSNSVSNKPVSEFTASPTVGFRPLIVHFKDTSTGSPTSWEWNFGDRTFNFSQNPTHVYMAPSRYNVTLTVRNASGSSISSKVITVLRN